MSLAQQQQLLGALFSPWHVVTADRAMLARQKWPEAQFQRGLLAYRSNASLQAAKVLGEVFPAVKRELNQLQGVHSFDGLAKHLWLTKPPQRGDLAQWGECLIEFIKNQSELVQDLPHLPDLATLEWALHAAATQADLPKSEQEPSLQIVALLQSKYGIVSCLQHANSSDSYVPEAPPTDYTQLSPQNALVYRQGFKSQVIAISDEQAAAMFSI